MPPSSFTGFTSKRWLKVADVPHSRPLSWAIGVQAADANALQATLAKVSSPDHDHYGRYLSAEAANTLTAPAPESLEAIHAWLGHRRTTFSAATNVLTVHSTVGETRRLLATAIGEFEHVVQVDGAKTVRALRATAAMTMPSHIEAMITFTTLDNGPIHVNAKGHPIQLPISNLESAEVGKPPLATPAYLKKLYNVPTNTTVKLATQSIAAFYDESWSPDDLAAFQKQYSLPASVITQKGDRPNIATNPGGEASLDIQYITAMAPGAPTTVWTINGSNPFSSGDEPFVSWADQVLADPNPSLVHSISYGDEEDHIMEVSKDYAFHLDTLFQKMAVRGLTVLVASGDNGVSGTRISSGDHNVTEGCAKSAPEWPASSPWVTTVGASQVGDDGTEIVCSGATNGLITSGGGFSSVYDTPSYQKDAVLSYLAGPNSPHKDGFFNTKGRGYPDISALGANFPVFIKGKASALYGTSASTPLVAGLVTLWNEIRLQHGLPSVGFFNPLLYKIGASSPSAFHDVVVGNNGAGVSGKYICPISFGAGPGWDAVTGFGTPVFDQLATLVLANGTNGTNGCY